jgi:hypothetical protein
LRGPIKELVRHFRHRGRLLAKARMTDIFVINALGGGLRQITHTRLAAEGAPRWDPSGGRLSYSRWRPFGSPSESPFRAEGTAQGFGRGIWEINADGSCATKVFEQPVSEYEAAVWQPGVGRGAGPIRC